MRIIGTIEHPQLKISVFKNDGRLSLKLENPLYEQTYKFGSDERFSTLEDVRKFADERFIASVLQQFQAMHEARLQSLAVNFPAETDFFEEII